MLSLFSLVYVIGLCRGMQTQVSCWFDPTCGTVIKSINENFAGQIMS